MSNENNAGVDLDKLEALARAATPGPWTDGWPAIPFEDAVERIYAEDVHTREDASFIAAANPAAILALIDLARRASATPSSKDAGGEPVAYLTGDGKMLVFADSLKGSSDGMTPLYATAAPSAVDYEEVLAGHRRLVRELDVALNGEAGAAKQASLCDIVSQVKAEGIRSAGAAAKTEQAPTGSNMYRKKPVVIQAMQWTGDNLFDVIAFTDGKKPDIKGNHAGMMWDQYSDLVASEGLKIYTLEGKMNAAVGDWIIKGVKGEHYPCKPDIFAATYEQASAAGAGSEQALPAFKISRFSDTQQRGVLVTFERRLSDAEVETICAALGKQSSTPEAPAPSRAADGQQGAWDWQARAKAAEGFLRNYADTNMEMLLDGYHVQPIIRRLAAAILEWQTAALARAPLPAQDGQAVDDARDAAQATLLEAAGAGRLVRCHNGSGEPFVAYDKVIADRVISHQACRITRLRTALQEISEIRYGHEPDSSAIGIADSALFADDEDLK